MKKLTTALSLALSITYAEPQWLPPTPTLHLKPSLLHSCWVTQYCNKPNNQPILSQIKNQLVKNNNTGTNQTQSSQSSPTISETNQQSQNQQTQNNQHKQHKLFTNTVFISDPTLITNINYLYKMHYLPFHVINYTQIGDDYQVTYQWDAKHVPHKLVQLSITSPHSILYRSAILRFMKDYHIHFDPTDTQYASNVLEQAYETGFTAPKPFVWVYVDQHIPQKVYVWQNGKYIFKSPANTGVRRTTKPGNYMIYLRFRKTEMKGTFPGTHIHYDDPDVPWVNYFHGGEAIHGFPRRHYGYPQSAGCVELPIFKAKELYPMLYKYVVVTVSRE
jgi:hypothetical protein